MFVLEKNVRSGKSVSTLYKQSSLASVRRRRIVGEIEIDKEGEMERGRLLKLRLVRGSEAHH